MKCPKCNASIGVYPSRTVVSFGTVFGISCLVCGYWRQLTPRTAESRRPASQPIRRPAASN